MSLSRECEILRHSPLFAGVDLAQLKLLVLMAENRTFHDGECLMRQGEDGNAAFVLLNGDAEILVEAHGKDTAVARVGAHEVVGEMALLTEGPRSATVRALGTVQALRIDRTTFLKLLKQFPEMGLELLRVMTDRLEHTTAELANARAALACAASGSSGSPA
ncbi:cyclic nucleotide-binding domain-containing protein [Oceanicella sp. SM1341]|uniref:cyclic nucleotide-binding domain-containing protein n=1 Tax=Oceanicella sp. SM1341 TaxID=1548889 RepID=UPI000E4971A3|nr:cyclic nucleotide-binding domain-containing protein [Oceanicella sp. SM1341]